MTRLLLHSLVFAAVSATVVAQQRPTADTSTKTMPTPVTGFVSKTLSLEGQDHRYAVYVPPDYRPDRRWPLVLFLHGMGECGTDGRRHLEVGLPPAIRAEPQRWPCVVLCPQKPDRPSQWTDHERMVLAMLAATEAEYSIEPSRRYLTGLSQGGSGTWLLGSRHVERWAAIAPVCGYGKPEAVRALRDTPIWALHGDDDKVVPSQQSKDLCAAVAAAGGRPLLTLYPGVGHNSWDRAYRDEVLPEWLLAAPTERLGVWYLADDKRIEAMTLSLRAGAVHHALELGPRGVTWTVEDGDSAPRNGELGSDAGRAFALARLQQLRAGGVFSLPRMDAAATPGDGDLRIQVDLHGVGGAWQFACAIPAAQLAAPETKTAAAAVLACTAELGALR